MSTDCEVAEFKESEKMCELHNLMIHEIQIDLTALSLKEKIHLFYHLLRPQHPPAGEIVIPPT